MASKVEYIITATDDASATINKVNGELGVSEKQISKVGAESKNTSMTWADLNGAVALGKEAFAVVNQVIDQTIGKFQIYAQQVRDLSVISGQNSQDTSRFIQVLDDFRVSAEDATAATKALTRQGLAPNIDTLASLSDQYLAITDTQQRNEFVLKNLGKAGLEWNQVLQQGSSALRENAAGQNAGLILSQEMLDRAERLRVAQDNLTDSTDALTFSISEDMVPALTGLVNWLNAGAEGWSHFFKGRQEQLQIETAMNAILKQQGLSMAEGREPMHGLTKATNDQVEAARAQAVEQWKANDAISNSVTSNKAATISAEELAAAQQKVSDINNKLVSAIGSLQTADDAYTRNAKGLANQRIDMETAYSDAKSRGYEKTVGEYKGYEEKIAGLKEKEADLAAERDKQTLQFISNMLLQKLQVDGMTDKEFEAFAKQQKAWGLWSDDTVAKAQKAWLETDKITASINAIPDDKTLNFTTRYTVQGYSTASNAPVFHGDSPGERRSNAAGGSFMIPESYGNEGFRMGNGDTASGGELITITPKGQQGATGGSTTVNLNVSVNGSGLLPDPQETARQLLPALKIAMREVGVL